MSIYESESSDSDFESGEENQNYSEDIEKIEEFLSENPNSYNETLEYINLLRKSFQSEKLHETRLSAHESINFPKKMYAEWLKDEKTMNSEGIPAVYERILEQYAYPDFWLDFLQHLNILVSQKKFPVEEAQKHFEKALKIVGTYYSEANALWDEYRMFLVSAQPENYQNLILNSYETQISYPIENLTNVIAEMSKWSQVNKIETPSNEITEELEVLCQVVCEFNTKINTSINTTPLQDDGFESDEYYSLWSDYAISMIVRNKTAHFHYNRVVCGVFEKGILTLYHREEWWGMYINFVRTLVSTKELLAICERGVKNCSFSSFLWVLYMEIVEETCAEDEVFPNFDVFFNRVLSSPFQQQDDSLCINLAYCQCLIRIFHRNAQNLNDENFAKIRNIITNLADYVASQELTKVSFNFLCDSALFYKSFGNYDEARRILEMTVSCDPHDCAIWKNYIDFEIHNGSGVEFVRKLCERAIRAMRTESSRSVIEEEWLRFERWNGTIKSVRHAHHWSFQEYCKIRSKSIQTDADKRKEKRRLKNKRNRMNQKRKQEEVVPHEGDEDMESTENVQEALHSPKKGKVVLVSEKSDQKSVEKAVKKVESHEAQPSEENPFNWKRQEYIDENTVFVINLRHCATEEEIKEFFSPCGNVIDVRILRTVNNKSRGICHVEFDCKEAAMKAIEHKHLSIFQERKLKVQKYRRNTTHSLRSTVYVKNMPISGVRDHTQLEKELREIFGGKYEIVDIRFTYAKGFLRHFCFIEFASETGAEHALTLDKVSCMGAELRVLPSQDNLSKHDRAKLKEKKGNVKGKGKQKGLETSALQASEKYTGRPRGGLFMYVNPLIHVTDLVGHVPLFIATHV